MTTILRDTATSLKNTNPELDVFLDEAPGEETALSVYVKPESLNVYVDVFVAGDKAEFWHEGSKRSETALADAETLSADIRIWLATQS